MYIYILHKYIYIHIYHVYVYIYPLSPKEIHVLHDIPWKSLFLHGNFPVSFLLRSKVMPVLTMAALRGYARAVFKSPG